LTIDEIIGYHKEGFRNIKKGFLLIILGVVIFGLLFYFNFTKLIPPEIMHEMWVKGLF
jgi:hypothetical protein